MVSEVTVWTSDILEINKTWIDSEGGVLEIPVWEGRIKEDSTWGRNSLDFLVNVLDNRIVEAIINKGSQTKRFEVILVYTGNSREVF